LQDTLHDAIYFGRERVVGLIGLQFDNFLAGLDRVAFPLIPAQNRRFRQRLRHLWHTYLYGHSLLRSIFCGMNPHKSSQILTGYTTYPSDMALCAERPPDASQRWEAFPSVGRLAEGQMRRVRCVPDYLFLHGGLFPDLPDQFRFKRWQIERR